MPELSLVNWLDGEGCTQDSAMGYAGMLVWVLVSVYLFAGMYVLCEGYFIPALTVLSLKLGLSDDVSGATLMAMGTSSPELFTALIGVFLYDREDNPGPATNCASAAYNMCVIIGMSILLSGRSHLPLKSYPFVRDSLFYALALFLLHSFYEVTSPGQIELWEAACLVLHWVVYVLVLYFQPYVQPSVVAFCKCLQSTTLKAWRTSTTALPMTRIGTSLRAHSGARGNSQQYVACDNDDFGLGHEKERERESGFVYDTSQRISKLRETDKRTSVAGVSGNGLLAAANDSEIGAEIAMVSISLSPKKVPSTLLQQNDSEKTDDIRVESSAPPIPVLLADSRREKHFWKTIGCSMLRPYHFLFDFTVEKINAPSNEGNEAAMTPAPTTSLSPAIGNNHFDLEDASTTQSKSMLLPPDADNSTDSIQSDNECVEDVDTVELGTAYDSRNMSWRLVKAMMAVIVWLFILSFLAIDCATKIGVCMGLSADVMGITLLAVGSSLPDTFSSVLVARQGKGDMAVSNAMGSNMFDICVCLGLPFMIKSLLISGKPLSVENNPGFRAFILALVLMLVFLCALMFHSKLVLRTYQGIILVSAYVVFIFVFCIVLNH